MRSIIRGGVFLLETTTSEFTDATVAAGQTYQCAIAARDYHLNAMGRNGWSANFGLSYNSQLWRQDPAATWKLGRDVGYGFGWRFQAGSLTPYWQDPWIYASYCTS